MLDVVEVQTDDNPVGSVIWLHGLGADGHDFEPVVPELRLPATLPLRFVFPHAPIRPVTLNGGMPMRAWYDIVSLDSEGRADETGIRDSSAQLDQLIEREQERGIPRDRIAVAGFSQGGAIALHNALCSTQVSDRPLAGLMLLSTYLVLPSAVPAHFAAAAGFPVFVGHGTLDPMVPHAMGKHAAETLQGLGFEVAWHEYPIAHSVSPQEIADISRWLVAAYAGHAHSPLAQHPD